MRAKPIAACSFIGTVFCKEGLMRSFMRDYSKKSFQMVHLKTRVLAVKIIENHSEIHVYAFKGINANGDV